MTTYADIDGAVTTARIAAQFNWTWKSEDVARFCAAAGWQIEERSRFDIVLRTNLAVSRNQSTVYLADRRRHHALAAAGHEISAVYAYVADLGASDRPFTEADVADQYLLLRSRFEAEFGIPARATKHDTVMWEHTDVFIGLTQFSNGVDVLFVNPVYQRTVDERAEGTDEEETW